VIFIVGKGDKLRYNGEILKFLRKKYDISYLILVEKTKKIRQIVESLISPGKLIGLNEIFVPTGDIQYKALISKIDKDKILFTKDELEELIEEISTQIIRISFE